MNPLEIAIQQEELIKYLQARNLLKANIVCDRCNAEMKLKKYKCADHFFWRCSKRTCNKKVPIRVGSFFEIFKTSIYKILMIIHCFVHEISQKKHHNF